MLIEDGTGRGFIASVSDSNRFNVSAKTNPRIFYASRDAGQAFTVVSVNAAQAAGEYALYLTNTSSTRNLYVKTIHASSENACVWKNWSVTGTAAGGSVLIPANVNLGSGLTSESTSRGNGAVTGLTTDNLLKAFRSGANGHQHVLYEDALILTPGTAVALEYDTGTTGGVEVAIDFHFEDIGSN